MESREKIISIVDATVAAYSNAPVWHKTNILKYMQEYSDQQNKAKDDKISELEKLYSISDNKIAILNNENQQLQSRITELQSDIKRFKSIQSHETTRANELQDEVERLKSELKAAESGNEWLSKFKLEILNEVKFSFDIHSDFSSQCNGYKSLCKQIEQLKQTNKR